MSVCRVIKATKNALHPSTGNLHLSEGEIALEVDGTVPTQPVLQHIGISAWPGESCSYRCNPRLSDYLSLDCKD